LTGTQRWPKPLKRELLKLSKAARDVLNVAAVFPQVLNPFSALPGSTAIIGLIFAWSLRCQVTLPGEFGPS